MAYNNTVRLILILLLGVLILIIFMFFCRNINRNLINAQTKYIRIYEAANQVDGLTIPEEEVSDYAILVYHIDINNPSNRTLTINSIDPIIPAELKDKVAWYIPVSDYQNPGNLKLYPMGFSGSFRQLTVRRDNLDDGQVIDLFKAIRFNISYYRSDNANPLIKWLTIGYSKSSPGVKVKYYKFDSDLFEVSQPYYYEIKDGEWYIPSDSFYHLSERDWENNTVTITMPWKSVTVNRAEAYTPGIPGYLVEGYLLVSLTALDLKPVIESDTVTLVRK